MQLRSRTFESVLGKVRTSWPTIEQANLLSLKTDDEEEMCGYIRMMLGKSAGSQLRNRLAFLAICESIINSSSTLQIKFLSVLKALRNKLYDTDTEMYQYTLKISKVIAKFWYLDECTSFQVLFYKQLTRKEIRRIAWYFPRQYLAMRAFVEIIGEAVYNPGYRYCQVRELKFLESQ